MEAVFVAPFIFEVELGSYSYLNTSEIRRHYIHRFKTVVILEMLMKIKAASHGEVCE